MMAITTSSSINVKPERIVCLARMGNPYMLRVILWLRVGRACIWRSIVPRNLAAATRAQRTPGRQINVRRDRPYRPVHQQDVDDPGDVVAAASDGSVAGLIRRRPLDLRQQVDIHDCPVHAERHFGVWRQDERKAALVTW